MACYIIIGTHNAVYKEVYVSRTGNDSASCGHVTQPCKSIVQAVQQVEWGGHIYLDGTGTERHPYDCNHTTMHAGHSQLKVQKSLRMEGINLTPHVSCYGGFQFQYISRGIRIVLSGVSFRQTPLRFEGCNLVKVVNCSFRNATTALTVYIKNTTNTLIDIRGFSLFENNTSCLEVFTSNNQNQSLKVDVSDTTFQGNRHLFTKGAMTVKTEMRKSSGITHVQLQMSCFKVTYMYSYGYFVNIDLPAATTNEVYSNVTLVDNTVSHLMKSTGRGTFTTVKSLYTSRARKSYVKFTYVSCSRNQFLRCLRIQSDEVNVQIYNSSFVGQCIPTERGAAVSLESKTHATLVVANSTFRRNKAKSGGALFVHSKFGMIELTMTQVNFTECFATKFGCALLVGDPKTHIFTNRTVTYKLIANLRDVKVQNCSGVKGGTRRKCIVFHFLLFSGNVTINDSSWTNNLNLVDAALMIGNAGGKSDIAISGCTFVRNSALLPGVVIILAIDKQAGSVTVENSSLSSQQHSTNDLLISPKFRTRLINVLFNSSDSFGLAIFSLERMRVPTTLNIYIYNCAFVNNAHDILVNLYDPIQIIFTVKNTIFTTKVAKYKDSGIFFSVHPLKRVKSSNAVIQLDSVTFESRPSNIFKMPFPGKKSLKIKNSTFLRGVCVHKYVPRYNPLYVDVGTGALTILSNHDKLNRSGCVEKPKNENIHPLWNYDTDVIFEDTTFEKNAGLIAGAVYISNGNVTFNRCTFRDNFGTKRSGHVYSAYGTGRVHFKDCSFLTTMSNLTVNSTVFGKRTFLYSESGGPVKFENTSMTSTIGQRTPSTLVDISSGGYVDMDSKSTFECSTGGQLLFENNTHFVYVYNGKNGSSCKVNVTVLKYSCNLCPPGYYSLQKGVSHGLNVQASIECLPCPFGATCIEKNIAAKRDFWGYPNSDHPPSLSFFSCPEGYCQNATSNSNEYNRCYGNRTGFLCGKCDPEYTETLFSTECRKRSECNNYMLWIMTILYTTGLACYLLFKPPVLTFLGRRIVWFTKKQSYSVIQELGPVDSHSDKGYLKITFYFYQAAGLLIVGSAEELLHKIPFVTNGILAIVDAFNFQVRSLHKVIDCPLAGLTAVTKELLPSGTVFLTMAELLVIYGLHVTFNKIRRKEKPSPIHYIAVVIELLLLGYERLAESSLKLMHCVSIGSEKRLFIDAEFVCWQWWQYVLLTYVIVSVVPFIMVLYCGSAKLYNAAISSQEFLGACILPLPFLVYWLFKQTLNRDAKSLESRQSSKNVLEVLHGPFRQPSNKDNGTLYWESVLIGRRFILLSCHAFITNSMFKMVCMTTACVLMLLHHVLKNPYHDPIANKAETSSLLVLVLMAVINLTKATRISFGTSIVGPTKSYVKALEWFEFGALAFCPLLVCILAVFAVFSQLVRLVVSLTKLISRYVQWRTITLWLTELQTPILDTSDSEAD